MFTSPWYIKFRTASTSSYFMPFRYRSGWLCGFLLRTPLKNGEHAERITLCASSWFPSQANVTSKKSLSSLSSLKAVLTLVSNSFHFKQNFSPPPELPPADILDLEFEAASLIKILLRSHLVYEASICHVWVICNPGVLKLIKGLWIFCWPSRTEVGSVIDWKAGWRCAEMVGFGERCCTKRLNFGWDQQGWGPIAC